VFSPLFEFEDVREAMGIGVNSRVFQTVVNHPATLLEDQRFLIRSAAMKRSKLEIHQGLEIPKRWGHVVEVGESGRETHTFAKVANFGGGFVPRSQQTVWQSGAAAGMSGEAWGAQPGNFTLGLSQDGSVWV